MTFRIREARIAANFTQQQLADMLNISYATLSGYETGAHDPRSNTLAKIADICNVTVDYLLGIERAKVSKPTHSDDAMRIASEYDTLDNHGKKSVRAILDVELSRMEDLQSEAEKQEEISIVPEEQEPMITLPYFLESAAAGVPLWTEGEYENLDFPASFVPDGTDFAVGVKGRSMEPDYPEGCTVFVHQTEQINDGDVVIAWLQGEGTVIKRALVAGDKIIRLESINREYPDIVGHKLDGVKIFGKVLGYME